VDRATTTLRDKGGTAVLAGRFVAIVRALMPAAAGAAKMSYRTFALYNAAGGIIWGVGYCLLGYLAGSAYAVVERRVGVGLAIALAVVVVAVVLVWAVRRHRAAVGVLEDLVVRLEPQRAQDRVCAGGCVVDEHEVVAPSAQELGHSRGCRPQPRFSGPRGQAGEPGHLAQEELGGTSFDLDPQRLLGFEDGERNHADRAVVQVGDVRVEAPIGVRRVAVVLSVAVFLLPIAFVAIIPDPLTQPLGVDFSLYRDVAARWLAGGSYFEPHQLAGPYTIEVGDILYPPVGLWLFVPFAVLPGALAASLVNQYLDIKDRSLI